MTLEEKTYSLLLNAAGVTAHVPQARIKSPGDWEKLARPYIIHFPVSAQPDQMHSGQAPLTEWGYQVSVFTDAGGKSDSADRGYGAARTIAAAIVAALQGAHGDVTYFWQDQTHQYESEPPVHQIALTFQVFEAL